MSMRNGVTPKLKLTLTLTLTLTDTEDAVLTLMLGHRSLYITWQQHHNCRIVCELSLRILICILPDFLIIILPNFHVWCQEVVKIFIEIFIETFTEFVIVRKFCAILDCYVLV